jgi:predicted ABC-type ATPase
MQSSLPAPVEEFLRDYKYSYLSADVIAQSLAPRSVHEVRISAGRLFIERIGAQILSGESFIVETTLSGRTFHQILRRLRDARYEVNIVFIYLGSAQAGIARVCERVSRGGHAVPESDIIRRFTRSCSNFWHLYRLLADRWFLFYNAIDQFHNVAVGVGEKIEIKDVAYFDTFYEIVNKSNERQA